LRIGYAKDLKKRFKEHRRGKSASTKSSRPYILIFYESFVNRNPRAYARGIHARNNKKDAFNREEYLKSGWGFRTIKKILKCYFDEQ